jgi:hypothetical protein
VRCARCRSRALGRREHLADSGGRRGTALHSAPAGRLRWAPCLLRCPMRPTSVQAEAASGARSHPNRCEAAGSGPGIPGGIPVLTVCVESQHAASIGRTAGPVRHDACGAAWRPGCVLGTRMGEAGPTCSVAPRVARLRRPHHRRDTHQRTHSRSRGQVSWSEWRAGRHSPHRGRASTSSGSGPRPGRGCGAGPSTGLQADGLRQVQVRDRAEGS